jgi:cysteine desulfurase
MTLSAHKINGPKGIGCLYVRSKTKMHSMLSGGSQEYDLRPGTQNTAGIIGFAEAVKLLGDFEARDTAGRELRKITSTAIEQISKMKNFEINGPLGENRAPDNINFTIKGMDQEMAIAKLDLEGFAVSTGSACVSGSTNPSHVILSLKKNYNDPSATVRVTLGRENTDEEINSLITFLKTITK